MRFAQSNSNLSSYFHEYNILKFCDTVNIEACAFIDNCFNNNTFSAFAEKFKLVPESHAHNTRSSSKGLLFVSSYKTPRFGRKSIICSATLKWNHLKIQEQLFYETCTKSAEKQSNSKIINLIL